MIIVHHLNNSRSQRVLWLLEELGVPYDIKHYQRDPKTMLAPDSLRAVHPLGKSPVITDEGVTIAESGAIVEYLVDKYDTDGKLAPKRGTPERLRLTYWLHYAEGSAMSPLLLKLIFDRVEKAPFIIRPIAKAISKQVKHGFLTPQLTTHFDYMEAEVKKTGWFVGSDLTAADVQMSFPIEAGIARFGVNEKYPALAAFAKKIHERPAYKKALERGGPYDF